MFQQAHLANVSHAAALVQGGYRPSPFEPGTSLGVVQRRDDRQHVSDWTWKVMHLMQLQQLPVRGEVIAGNPAIRGSGQAAGTSAMEDAGNGILARVRGGDIAHGSQQLPPAGEAQKEQPLQAVTLDLPDLGRVTVTYRLNTYRHGRSRHWHWLAVRAEMATSEL